MLNEVVLKSILRSGEFPPKRALRLNGSRGVCFDVSPLEIMSEAAGKPEDGVLPIQKIFSLVDGSRSMLSNKERGVIDRYVNDGLRTVLVASMTPKGYSLVRVISDFDAYNDYALSRMIIMMKIISDLFYSNAINAIAAMPKGQPQSKMPTSFPYDFSKLKICGIGWSRPEECSDKNWCIDYCKGLRIGESTNSYSIDFRALFRKNKVTPNSELRITCPSADGCYDKGEKEFCFKKSELGCPTYLACVDDGR